MTRRLFHCDLLRGNVAADGHPSDGVCFAPQIFNVFDLLDPEERGAIGFAEFYYLALLLMAIQEVQQPLCSVCASVDVLLLVLRS